MSTPSPRGPVSDQLAASVQDQLRAKGLVIWLDPTRAYERFAASWPSEGPPRLLRHQGSFARLLLDLAPYGAAIDPHLPGDVVVWLPFDEAAVKRTPLLEVAAMGHRWQPDLKALVAKAAAGRVAPDALTAFVAKVTSLEEADGWLEAELARAQGGLSAELRDLSTKEILDRLVNGSALARRMAHPSDQAELLALLHHRTGMTEAFLRALSPQEVLAAGDIAEAVAGWAQCVEYLNDPVPRPPKAPILEAAVGLPGAVIDECRSLAQLLRERDPLFYERTADEVEELIAAERGVDPRTLGLIDTFRFEEDALLRHAVAQLQDGSLDPADWRRVQAMAEGRTSSFWLTRDDRRKMSWRLVLDAARLGVAIANANAEGLPQRADLQAAVDWYVRWGAPIDRFHRVLEQDRLKILRFGLPEYEGLRKVLDGLRDHWVGWADPLALWFSALCRREGFLPEPHLQQRHLFDQVVMAPEEGTTALFMVDAMRFEMAQVLADSLEGATCHLSARLAELPSITAVGMNVLAPVVVEGKLNPVVQGSDFKGFQVGEYRVKDPDTRRRAIHGRTGGANCPILKLDEVNDRDTTALRRWIAKARVVVVHSEELDQVGEASPVGIGAFEVILRQLREGWARLRDAGVRRFVITSDHGFLLRYGSNTLEHGTAREPQRRHVVSDVPIDPPGEVRVALSSLGYKDAKGFLHMPDGLQVFRTTQKPQVFVHGGNSLQERVIPVLVVSAPAVPKQDTFRYEVVVAPLTDRAGFHRILVTVNVVGLMFVGRSEVDVVLRLQDAPGATLEVWLDDKRDDGQHRIRIGEPTELFFRIAGGRSPKVAVLVTCGAEAESNTYAAGHFLVDPVTLERESAAVATPRPSFPEPSPAVQGVHDWLKGVADKGHRQVLEYIVAHGSITEAEIVTVLGSARLMRQFSAQIDVLVPKTAPFQVGVIHVNGLKQYRKEEG